MILVQGTISVAYWITPIPCKAQPNLLNLEANLQIILILLFYKSYLMVTDDQAKVRKLIKIESIFKSTKLDKSDKEERSTRARIIVGRK